MFKTIWKKIKPISNRKLLRRIENLESHIYMMRLESNVDKIFSIENFLSNSKNLSDEKYYTRDFNEIKFYLPFAGKDAIQTIIFKELSFFSIKELQKLDVILKQYICKEKAVAFDIGANIGNHSIYWAANKRFSQIYSFEPISYTYEILLKNIELNFLKDIIKAYNIGIGKEKSQAVLKHEHVNNIGANQVEIMQGGGIMINSLDDFMQEVSNLTRVDFVKIDVEGFEDNVFLGAKRFFEKFKPLIMVEIFDEHRKNIFEILKSYNYNLLTNISENDYIFIYKD